MRYMVTERFKDGKVKDVYCRFAEKGRMIPVGLHYVESWVSADVRVCYQLMETERFELLAEWTRNWDDLVDFEIVPVISSDDARRKAMSNSSQS